jgi:hypothetical protein
MHGGFRQLSGNILLIRAILSAVTGYFLMAAICMAGIAATWFGLGNRFAFVGDTNEASLGWSLIQLGVGFVAAWIAGIVATRIAGPQARMGIALLLAIILGLGGLLWYMTANSPLQALPEGKSIDTLSFAEAGEYARNPSWYYPAIIGVGCLGILIGFAQQLPSLLAEDKSQAPQV